MNRTDFTKSLTAGAAAAWLLACVPALSQVSAQPGGGAAYDRTNDRILRLENAMRDLQGAVYSAEPGAAPPPQGYPRAPSADASTVVRLQRMEQQLAEMTGRIEELTFRLATQQRQIDTMMEVMAGGALPNAGSPSGADGPAASDPRPQASAGAPDAVSSAPSGAPADLRGGAPLAADDEGASSRPAADVASAPAVAAPAVDLPADPDDAYDVAYEALLAGDYARSQAAFEAYTERFPDGVRTPEAKYLLGEIYLATGAYSKAASRFLDHVKSYPDDPRAPEAYLKLGTSFARLDKSAEACRVFGAGAAKFPDASASVKGRLASEQAKAGCAR